MPLPQHLTPKFTDKEAVERLLWTALHWRSIETGFQARRWLFCLAGRMHQVEARFPTALNGSPAYQAITFAYERAEIVRKEFGSVDIPLHMRAMREIRRRPYEKWEWVSWWSGTSKISHRVTRLMGGRRR